MASAAKTGKHESILDSLSADNWISPQAGPETSALDGEAEIADALRAALENPVDEYPPLSQSIFPGDTIAIVLQANLPKSASILQTLIETLLETNVEPADITVVLSRTLAAEFDLQTLETPSEDGSKTGEDARTAVVKSHPLDSRYLNVGFVIHDSDDPGPAYGNNTVDAEDIETLIDSNISGSENENASSDDNVFAYIAANQDALPMKVNRAIVDADVIIPVGWPVPGDNERLADCIYPAFSNQETLTRFAKADGPAKKRRGEIEFANAQLGAFFSLQAVTVPGGGISRFHCGSRSPVLERARDESNSAWSVRYCGSDQLVLATIESPADQDWSDFVEAVFVASEISASDLPIVIWSSISKPPPVEIRRAIERQFESGDSGKMSDRMRRLIGILEGRSVILHSPLSRNVTEEFGLGYLAGVEELNRLVAPHDDRVCIRDAHRVTIRVDDE